MNKSKSDVLCVAYSPDGKTLAIGLKDKTVLLWDTDTGETKQTLKGHKDSGDSTHYLKVGASVS